MDSVFEKITLYDLLGYMVPGSLFLILLYYGYCPNLEKGDLNLYEEYKGIISVCCVIGSYVCGIAISEIARWILTGIGHLLGKCCCIPGTVNGYDKLERDIGTEIIKSALQNSHLVEINSGITGNIVGKYWNVMYSDIQSDADYKRIHNYASAATMYKNMAFALLGGGVWASILRQPLQKDEITVSCVLLFCVIIFVVRWARFEKKKERYAVMWFVKKHIPNVPRPVQ